MVPQRVMTWETTTSDDISPFSILFSFPITKFQSEAWPSAMPKVKENLQIYFKYVIYLYLSQQILIQKTNGQSVNSKVKIISI